MLCAFELCAQRLHTGRLVSAQKISKRIQTLRTRLHTAVSFQSVLGLHSTSRWEMVGVTASEILASEL